MAEQKLTAEQRLNNFERLILMHDQSIKSLKEKEGKTDSFLTDILNKTKELDKTIEELRISLENGGGGSGGTGISAKDAENLIKDVLTKSQDIAEHISVSAKRAAALAVEKQEVQAYFDKESKKRKKSSGKGLIIFSLFFILIAASTFLYFNLKQEDYTLKAGEIFYSKRSNQPMSFEVPYGVKGKIVDNKFYFEIDDEVYYIKLQ